MMNTVGMEVQVRIDLAEMSAMLNNEQIRAVMNGIGQVIAASRHGQMLKESGGSTTVAADALAETQNGQ